MTAPVMADQKEFADISFVQTFYIVWRTCRKQWLMKIKREKRETELGKSVLSALLYIYIYIWGGKCVHVRVRVRVSAYLRMHTDTLSPTFSLFCFLFSLYIYIYVYIPNSYPSPECNTKSIFKRSFTGLNSLRTSAKVREENLVCPTIILIPGERIVGFIPSPNALAQCEIQTASSRL